MKKRWICFLLAAALTLSLCGGFGVCVHAASVHTVSTAEELYDLAERVNSGENFSNVKVVLAADIDLNDAVINKEDGSVLEGDFTEWTPIGTEEHPFTGVFDGKGYTVSGMYLNDTKAAYVGLLGVIEKATVYNVFVDDGYLNVDAHVGGIVGFARKDSFITNCHNLGVQTYSNGRSGGIVGWTDDSDVYNCSNYAYTYSKRCSGGIVGDVYDRGNIYNCVNHGSIDGKELVGGISGGTTSADIENCLNAGIILYPRGHMIAGGAGSRSIDYCYALKNDELNPTISFGSSGTSAIFTDESAVLDQPMKIGGVEYTRVVDLLNAWRNQRNDGVAYQQWLQEDSLPYLELDHIPSTLVMTENTFEDVSPEQWFYDEVKYVYDNGLMTGTSDDTFDPNLETTRAMVVTILYRQEGEPAAGVPDFSDVSTGRWYTAAISWAADVGVVEGYPDGSFKPEKPISREEVATIMYRYSNYKENDVSAKGDLNVFPDAHNVVWSKPFMEWAVGEGIINGTGGYLKPQDPALRSHVAAILMRYCVG